MTNRIFLAFGWLLLFSTTLFAQTTAFTYQGKLADTNGLSPNYDFQFKLYDALMDGNPLPIGSPVTVTKSGVLVTSGVFSVNIDFGACATCFDGSPRFLEIAVKPTSGLTFTTLSPRQPVSATPYAIRSLNGLTITGGGSFENSNTFAGVSAGASNTPSGTSTDGNFNSFFGWQAGSLNTTGHLNSFFGWTAGGANVMGNQNAFFGFQTGSSSTGGSGNTIVGSNADFGTAFATGDNNTLLGFGARLNSGLNNATAIGALARVTQSNSLVLGGISGTNGGTDTKVGIGTTAPGYKLEVIDPASNGLRVQTNGPGGAVASFGGNGAFFVDGPGTIGGRLAVLENGNVGIGTGTPKRQLHLSTNGQPSLMMSDTRGTVSNKAGSLVFDGGVNLAAPGWVFQDVDDNGNFLTNLVTILKNGNVGIGTNNPTANLHISGAGFIRATVNSGAGNAGFGLSLNNSSKWLLATTSQAGEFQIFNEALNDPALWIEPLQNWVGIGTLEPHARLDVSNHLFKVDGSAVLINNPGATLTDTNQRLIINGVIRAKFGTGVGAPLCANNSQEIAVCNSSSIRYKENITTFMPGLNLISRLRPVSFNWKQDGMADLGLIAEEVAKVEPLLVTHNEKDQIEGVKYDRVAVVLLNAVKEQQAQIKKQSEMIQRQQNELHSQERLIKQQQSQLASLKRVVCKSHPKARSCQ